MWTETVGRKTTRRLNRQDISRAGATCPVAQGTPQGGLSTCHVRRLFGQSAITVSQWKNRLNRENMFEQNNVTENLFSEPENINLYQQAAFVRAILVVYS